MRDRVISMLFVLFLFLPFFARSAPAQEWEKMLPPSSFTAEKSGEQGILPAPVPQLQKEVNGGHPQEAGGEEATGGENEEEVGIEEKVEQKEKEEIVETVPGSYTRPVRLPKVEGSRKPSRMELLFLGKISEKSQVLEQYGYDLFIPGPGKKDLMSTLYSSGIDKSYILGPGDEIQVFLSGEGVNLFMAQSKGGAQFFPVRPLPIDAEGRVFYPPIGMVHIWGKSLSEAEIHMKSLVKKYIKDFQISISLRKVRRFPVLVVGEVISPGTVPVNGYSTVTDAIILAGGVKKTGTLRNIKVKRNDEQIAVLDVYDLLFKGERKGDILLKDRDVIVVPPIGNTVAAIGMVKRPGIFEVKEEETVADLQSFFGGVLPGANVSSMKLTTHLPDGKKIIKEVRGGLLAVALSDGDELTVTPLTDELKEFVELRGHVKNPGFYQWRSGMKVKDVLESMDNFLPEGMFDYAEVVRRLPPGYSPEILSFNPVAALKGDEENNRELQAGDVVSLFSVWDFRKKPFVRIEGEVENPGRYRWIEGMTVRDLLRNSGGLTRASRTDEAELWRYELENSAYILKFDRKLDLGRALEGNKNENPVLQPFDQLVIKGVGSYEQLIWKTTVRGEVASPGTFPIKRGDRISDLIERAGGMTEFAYARGIVLLRKSVEELQRKRLRVLIAELEASLFKEEAASALGAETGEIALRKQVLESRKELLRVMREKMELVVGRIVVDIDKNMAAVRGTDKDIELENGDELFIPPVPSYVLMMGDVFNQVGLTFKPENRLRDYLFEVGGLTKNADRKGMYIIRADGTVVSNEGAEFADMVHWDKRRNRFTVGGLNVASIFPGDTIVVPTETKFPIPWRPLIKDITQIIFQSLSTVAIIDNLGN